MAESIEYDEIDRIFSSKIVYLEKEKLNAIFNHEFGINDTAFDKGKKIEQLIFFHTLRNNADISAIRAKIYRKEGGVFFNILNSNNTIGTIDNFSKSGEDFIIIALQVANVYKAIYNPAFFDQYQQIKSILKPDYRCLMNVDMEIVFPDMFIDNVICDIKTDKNFNNLPDHFKQIMRHYFIYQIYVAKEDIEWGEQLTKSDYKLFLRGIDHIGLYYYKFNRFLKWYIEDIFSIEEIENIVTFYKKYFIGNLMKKQKDLKILTEMINRMQIHV